MFVHVSRFILKNRILLIVFLTVCTAFMAYKGQNVKLSYENTSLLPEKDSTRVEYNEFKKLFGEDGNVIVIGTKNPDIILTDVEMPRMDGYELVSTITKNAALSKIPMVFITSRAGDKHRDRAIALGINEYLTKPFEESELVATVKRLTH